MDGAQRRSRVLIVSDVSHPRNNRIGRMTEAMRAMLEAADCEVLLLSPDSKQGMAVAMPGSAMRLELFGRTRVSRAIKQFKPDYLHIATSGPLGEAARHVCLEQDRRFTTACQGCYPDHLARRIHRHFLLRGWADRLARALGYRAMRRFHGAASAVLVRSAITEQRLRQHRVAPDRLIRWPENAATLVAALAADKPPLRPSYFKSLIYDLLIGWPLALLQWIPGLWLLQWGGKYLASGFLHLRERRMNRPKLDDFE